MKCELNRSLARFTRGQKVSNEDFLAGKYKKMKNYFVFGKFVCYFVAWNAPLWQVPASTIDQVPSTIYLGVAGRKAVVVTPYYIYNNEREEKEKTRNQIININN